MELGFSVVFCLCFLFCLSVFVYLCCLFCLFVCLLQFFVLGGKYGNENEERKQAGIVMCFLDFLVFVLFVLCVGHVWRVESFLLAIMIRER